MVFVVNNSELYHYGIKRRSGRYPFGSGKNPHQHESKLFERSLKDGKDRAMISPAEKIAKETGNIADNSGRIARTVNKGNRNLRKKAKEMSDEELRQCIRRLELEQRYRSLSASDVDTGKMTVADYASILASTAAIAGSAATIWSLLKDA